MKILAKFIGKVNEFNEPPALSYVTLKNVDNNESVDTDAISEKLKAAGIDHAGCEFEVLIGEDDAGKQIPILKKLESQPKTESFEI